LLVHKGHANARKFFTKTNAGSYDSIVRLATFGRDSSWKRKILKVTGRRKAVLELACGTGILSLMLVKAGKRVTGLDLTLGYLAAAKRRVQLPLAQGTAEILPYRNESFDAVVSSYLAKYVDLQRVADECWRVLKPGGVVALHDFTYPKAGAMRSLWDAYFNILRMAGKVITSWKDVFDQLDDVIIESDWVRQAESALCSRGFQNASCRYYTAGTAAIVTAEKP
jgi:demethylmenaquinone methyltransferase/2-methoxy-6-polyprenyl-1,4-benzoquinol methylase